MPYTYQYSRWPSNTKYSPTSPARKLTIRTPGGSRGSSTELPSAVSRRRPSSESEKRGSVAVWNWRSGGLPGYSRWLLVANSYTVAPVSVSTIASVPANPWIETGRGHGGEASQVAPPSSERWRRHCPSPCPVHRPEQVTTRTVRPSADATVSSSCSPPGSKTGNETGSGDVQWTHESRRPPPGQCSATGGHGSSTSSCTVPGRV